MSRALPALVGILALLCGASPARAESPAPERGTAITDPAALRALESRFGLRAFIPEAATREAPIPNDELFALPAMAPLRRALDG